MKRTLDVNIGGFVFHIDEDAYEKLNIYIESLKKHYKNSEEGEEIINDIESRIAELLHEKKSNINEVITSDDINSIISTLGSPEDIFEEEEPPITYKAAKKLYRDPDNRILGGVSAGLAAYFGLPIILIRILFIIFAFASFGIAILIYMILWIVTPKAITAKQKLEMKGDPINVSNIEKSIKQEYSEVKENIKSQSPKIKKDINTFWGKVRSFFLGIGRVILILLGCILIVTGSLALLSIIGTLFLTNWVILPFGDLHLYNIVPELILNTPNTILFYISIFLILGIPFIMLVFAGLKLIFRFKSNTAIILISSICLWLFGIINVGLISINQAKQYSKKTTIYSEPSIIESTSDNTIRVKCIYNINSDKNDFINLNDIYITEINGQTLLLGEPDLNFEKSETGNFEILLKRKSRGKDKQSAYDNVNNITYEWNFRDSVLYLDKYFMIKGKQHWKAQEMDIIIKVPENKNVVLEKDVFKNLDLNNNDFYNYYLNYKKTYTWKMKESGRLQVVK